MLQSLDTLIAFIVIMTIVSLFVTIIVQMVSTWLSLRGKNLANALALTFQTIDPALKASAYLLAAKILSYPLLSDSTRTFKDRGKHDAPTPTEPWSAFTLWFDKAVKLATAIRPEEVYDALKKLAAGYEMKNSATIAAENDVSEAQKALIALSTTDDKTGALKAVADAETSLAGCKKKDITDFDLKLLAAENEVGTARQNLARAAGNAKKKARVAMDAAQKKLDDCLPGTAWKLLTGLGAPTDKDSAVADKLSAFGQLASAIPANLKDQFDRAMKDTNAQLVGIIDTERDKFESWFKSAQDRAQQWFQLHTRVVTVCASICIAFLFQLDAVEVFHYVSTNSAARTALVTKADTVVQQADGIVNEKGGLVQRIADDWNKAEPNHQLANAGAIQNTGQLKNELRKVAAAGPKPIEDFEARYNQIGNATIKTYYDEKQKLLDQLAKEANATGFDLIPTAFWRWPARVPPGTSSIWNGWYHPRIYFSSRFVPYLTAYWSHFLGMTLFAALLTLGAPYWYNLLKNLTSLRPALTQLLGKDDTAQTPPKK